MSALAEIYLKTETLEKMLSILKKTQKPGVAVTVSIDDKTNSHGGNVSAYVAQSKEERDAKKEKFRVAYGKVFWTSGTVVKAEKKEETAPPLDDDEDLGF